MPSREPAREQILAAVRAAQAPIDVDQIQARTGIPTNTVRRHLEVLVALDQVRREKEAVQGRGRPRWLYRPGDAKPELFNHLVEALTYQLTHAGDQEAVNAVAEAWAELAPLASPRASADEAVQATAQALTQLGFGAEVTPLGDEIALTRCPYAKLVSENPIICDIHAALVSKLLEQSGQTVSLNSVEVWSSKNLCRVHLNRPDLHATRTITSADLLPTVERQQR